MRADATLLFGDELSLTKKCDSLRASAANIRISTPKRPHASPEHSSPKATQEEDNVHEIFFAVDCSLVEHVTSVLEEVISALSHTDTEGNTALHHAVLKSVMSPASSAVIALLVDRGADIHALNKDGKSSLDMAWECDVTGKLYGLLLALSEVRDECNALAESRMLSLPSEHPIRDLRGIQIAYGLGRGFKPSNGSWCGRFHSGPQPTKITPISPRSESGVSI
jgi:hypothetical protein